MDVFVTAAEGVLHTAVQLMLDHSSNDDTGRLGETCGEVALRSE
jgi:hypothetical protein